MRLSRCDFALFQDSDILAANSAPESKVAYLLSLGVLDEYRENGIGVYFVSS